MKKYFAAGAVAVMVFAFAAMAASLNITAPTLQVGESEGDLKCADAVNVDAWGYNDGNGKVTHVTLKAVNNTCEDEFLYLTVLDNDNAPIGGAYVVTDFGARDDDAFQVDTSAGNIDASAIGGVRIGIDQGYPLPN